MLTFFSLFHLLSAHTRTPITLPHMMCEVSNDIVITENITAFLFSVNSNYYATGGRFMPTHSQLDRAAMILHSATV